MPEKNITKRATAHGIVYDVRISVKGSDKRYFKGGLPTLEAAIKERDKFKRARSAQALMRQRGLTTLELLNAWMEATSEGKTGSTIMGYQNIIDLYIGPHLNIPIMKLGARRLEAFIEELPSLMRRDSSTYSTAKRVVTMLRAALRWAARPDVRLIEDNPLAGVPVKLPSAPPARGALTVEHLQALLDNATGDAYYLWLLLAMTGLRKGEATPLQWKDVNFVTNTINVHRIATPETRGRKIEEGRVKMGALREVPMDPVLREELLKWKTQRNAELDQFLFRSPRRSKEQIAYGCIESWWNRDMAAAGIDPKAHRYTPHSLRHTFTTLTIDNGADVTVVSKVLGHSSPAITLDTYRHVTAASKVAAVSVMGGLLRGRADTA